jgi:hypothetical protein
VENTRDINYQKRYTYAYDKLTNSSVSQVAFSVLGLGSIEHILGVIEGELKKKQEESEKSKFEAEEKMQVFSKEATEELIASSSRDPFDDKKMLKLIRLWQI